MENKLLNPLVIESSQDYKVIATSSALDIYKKDVLSQTMDGFVNISALLIVDDTVFVADSGLSEVSVINLENYEKRVLIKELKEPSGLELVHTNLFISLAGMHTIIALNLDSLDSAVIAGSGVEGLEDGVSQTALLSAPQALGFDEDRLWFLDTKQASLRYMLGREVFTEFSDKEGFLQEPRDMVLGRYGDGCGVGRLFFADKNAIKVYNPEDKSMQVLIENIAQPISLTKTGCKLYFLCEGEEKPLVYDLKKMALQTGE